MKTGPVIALLILLAFGIQAVAGEGADDPSFTLKDLTLGETVFGETHSVKDLAHRVVLVEFWGINCGPCIASIPKLSKWQTDYEKKGLVVIGVHCQRASNESLVSLAKEKGVTYSIVANGRVSGANFTGIPYCFLFDSTGDCVYTGSPFRVESHLKDALSRAPFAALGDREFVKLKSISDALTRGMPPASALKRAQGLVNSSDEATADEAKYIVETLSTWGRKLIDDAMGAKDSEPLRCVTGLHMISRKFEGTDIGKQAAGKMKDLKKDAEFRTELRACQVLRKIAYLEDTLKVSRKDKSTTSASFRKENYAALSLMRKGVLMMQKKYPDAKATADAESIGEKYALLDK